MHCKADGAKLGGNPGPPSRKQRCKEASQRRRTVAELNVAAQVRAQLGLDTGLRRSSTRTITLFSSSENIGWFADMAFFRYGLTRIVACVRNRCALRAEPPLPIGSCSLSGAQRSGREGGNLPLPGRRGGQHEHKGRVATSEIFWSIDGGHDAVAD